MKCEFAKFTFSKCERSRSEKRAKKGKRADCYQKELHAWQRWLTPIILDT
jgi:hypothetical protein